MKLELKNLKINNRLSEETICFSATLYVDGQKAANVANRGCGGPHEYHWLLRGLRQPVEDWAKTQPMEYQFEQLDQLISGLVVKGEVVQKLARMTKKQTLFRLTGDKSGSWRTVGCPLNEKVKDFIVGKYAGQVECIANEDLQAAAAFC